MRRVLIGVVALTLASAGAALAQPAGEPQTVRVCVQVGDEESCRELENVDPRIASRILEWLENPPPAFQEFRRRIAERLASGRAGILEPQARGRASQLPQLGGLTIRQLPNGGWMIVLPPQGPAARGAPALQPGPRLRTAEPPRLPAMAPPARLGVSVADFPERPGAEAGVYVVMVQPGSPAAEAGLQGAGPAARRTGAAPGDRIVSLNGQPVTSAAGFVQAIAQLPEGAEITLVLARGDETITVGATLRGAPRTN